MPVLLDFHFCGGRVEALVALMNIYPGYSFKRILLKGFNALNQVGPRLLPKKLSQIGCAERALPELGPNDTRAFLLHKIDQNGRFYVVDQHAGGGSRAITKLALNEKAAKGIRHEAKVLNLLAGRTSFDVPRVLSFESWNGGCALRTSAVSQNRKAHKKCHPLPDSLFTAIADLRSKTLPNELPAAQIEGWNGARGRVRTPEICKAAMEINPETFFSVSAAHRDLGSENIFSCKSASAISEFTLIDWEFFTETAPTLTDRVGVWLGCRHRTLKGSRNVGVSSLAAEFLADFECAPGGAPAAVVALLHLSDLGIDLARILIGDARGPA